MQDGHLISLKKYLLYIFVMVHPCIVQYSFCTNVHSEYCGVSMKDNLNILLTKKLQTNHTLLVRTLKMNLKFCKFYLCKFYKHEMNFVKVLTSVLYICFIFFPLFLMGCRRVYIHNVLLLYTFWLFLL